MGLSAVIGWCVFGLIVGAIARFLMPGRQNMGCFTTILLGVAGSFAGGFIASLFSGNTELHANPAGWIMSVVGAIVVLFIYSKVAGGRM